MLSLYHGKRKLNTHPELFRFVILIPHRDTVKIFEEYRTGLFTKGLLGACSFPAAAPLAETREHFSRGELTELARNIRGLTKETDGKITSSAGVFIQSCRNFSFFGPKLNLPAGEAIFPGSAARKIISPLLPPIFCAAITEEGINYSAENLPKEAPSLSFRPAFLANLSIRPLKEGAQPYSFEWRIGRPVWLPKYKIILK